MVEWMDVKIIDKRLWSIRRKGMKNFKIKKKSTNIYHIDIYPESWSYMVAHQIAKSVGGEIIAMGFRGEKSIM